MVQLIYHEAVTNGLSGARPSAIPKASCAGGHSQSQAGNFQLTMTPWMVQTISGIADNFLRQIMVGKETHVQKVPQWFGGDDWILGRHDSHFLDRQHSGLDPDARNDRIQQ
jgi:hypothetical protein